MMVQLTEAGTPVYGSSSTQNFIIIVEEHQLSERNNSILSSSLFNISSLSLSRQRSALPSPSNKRADVERVVVFLVYVPS